MAEENEDNSDLQEAGSPGASAEPREEEAYDPRTDPKRIEHFQSVASRERNARIAAETQNNDTAAQLKALQERVGDLGDNHLEVARRMRGIAKSRPDEYNEFVSQFAPELSEGGQQLINVVDERTDPKYKELRQRIDNIEADKVGDRIVKSDERQVKQRFGFDMNDEENVAASDYIRSLVAGGRYSSFVEAMGQRREHVARLLGKTDQQLQAGRRVATLPSSNHVPSGPPAKAKNHQEAEELAFKKFAAAGAGETE